MPVSPQRLAGKTAVITGTASGQGRVAAVEQLTFADWKWTVEHEMDVVFLPVKYFWPQLIQAP